MTSNSQKPRYLFFVLLVIIALSLACNINSLIGQADPDLQLEGEFTNQEKTDLQPYQGTFQSEIIDVKSFSGEYYCPEPLGTLSHAGEVNHQIDGDILIITRSGLSSYLTYDPTMDAFCRKGKVPSEMTFDKEIIKTYIIDCVSFSTKFGTKISNHRRYYKDNGPPTLCFDQQSQIIADGSDQGETGSDSSLIGQCIASPNMYQVEFANVNDDYSNETKKVCRGDFIIRNISSENISLRYYNIYDDGAKHIEGWTYLHILLGPGEITESSFGSQKWTDGSSTIDAFTELIVVHSFVECTNLIRDENISIWGESTVPLNDPCR